MSAPDERRRPVKQFRVLQPYGPYVKGAIIQPTGLLRSMLVQRGLIEEVKEDKPIPALFKAPPEPAPAANSEPAARERKRS